MAPAGKNLQFHVGNVASAVSGTEPAGKSPAVSTDHSSVLFALFTRRCWNAADPANAAGTALAFVAFASTLLAASAPKAVALLSCAAVMAPVRAARTTAAARDQQRRVGRNPEARGRRR